MDGLNPAVAEGVARRQPGHLHEARAQVFRFAIGTGAEEVNRAEVGDQPELLFAHLEFGHGPREGLRPIGDLLLH